MAGANRGGANIHNIQPTTIIMIKLLLITTAALLLASCEGLNVNFQGDKGAYTYSSEGGLVITPKAIQLIEPAK